MQRNAFTMKLKPGFEEEYEIRYALRGCGCGFDMQYKTVNSFRIMVVLAVAAVIVTTVQGAE